MLVPFKELDEAVICSEKPFGMFVHFLTCVYVIKSDNNKHKCLCYDVVTDTLLSMLNMVKHKFKSNGSEQTKVFLTCLEDPSNTERLATGHQENYQSRDVPAVPPPGGAPPPPPRHRSRRAARRATRWASRRCRTAHTAFSCICAQYLSPRHSQAKMLRRRVLRVCVAAVSFAS